MSPRKSAKEKTVPAQPRPTQLATRRLSRLPRRPDLTLEGGIRPLSVYVREGDAVVQPSVALWIESQAGLILAHRLLTPEAGMDRGLTTAIDGLVAAIESPSASARQALGEPGLPGAVRVDDADLAEAVRSLLEPLDVATELAPSLPFVDEAASSLDDFLGGSPDAPPPEPFQWNVDPTLLPALYEAAASFARRAPWEYMTDDPPLAITLGSDGPQRSVHTLYACVLGSAGMVQGIALYYSLAQLRKARSAGESLLAADELREAGIDDVLDKMTEDLRSSGVPADQVPPDMLRAAVTELVGEMEAATPRTMENALALYFDTAEESDPTYLRWLRERDLPLTSRDVVPTFIRIYPRREPRLLNNREVRALVLALQAVNGFLSRYRRRLATPFISYELLTARVKVSGGRSIEVRWPGDE